MASSIAFWLENPSSSTASCSTDSTQNLQIKNTNVELHFNYWSLKTCKEKFSSLLPFTKNDGFNCLDVGVRLSDVGDFESINFYFPFDAKTLQYDDKLGNLICNNQELMSAIFNSPLDINKSYDAQGAYSDVCFHDDSNKSLRFFTDIPLSSNHGNGIPCSEVTKHPINESGFSGSILSFPRGLFKFHDDKACDSYFRFRVFLNESDLGSLSRFKKPSFKSITNYFESNELIDFRLNEIRNLPKTIVNKINKNYKINKIHFFLIRDSEYEYKMSHDSYKRCRILEKNIWDDYIQSRNGGVINDEILIYHWKADSLSYEDHFAAFAKFGTRTLKYRDIFFVLFFLLSVGVVSGLIVNWLWSKLSDVQPTLYSLKSSSICAPEINGTPGSAKVGDESPSERGAE